MRALLRVPTLPLLAALALPAALAAAPSGGPAVAAAAGDRIDAALREALDAGGPQRILVVLDPARAGRERGPAELREPGFAATRSFARLPLVAGIADPDAVRRIAARPEVRRVGLDGPVRGQLVESVPLIDADRAADAGYDGSGVTVAVIDSGIDTDHPDLAGALVAEACFCARGGGCCPAGGTQQGGAGSAEDDHGHGTHISGALASAGFVAGTGAAPGAGIVAVKVLDATNSGLTSDVVAALDWILDQRPDVDLVNLSLSGGTLYAGDCDDADADAIAFATALDALRAAGVLAFSSSGNDGSTSAMRAPACVDSVVAVGGVWDAELGPFNFGAICSEPTTGPDRILCLSNRNAETDLLAPGALLVSDRPGGSTIPALGTSQAVPLATGCAALLLQAAPSLGPAALRDTLVATGRPVVDPASGGATFPRVDCLAAVRSVACLDVDGDGVPAGGGCPGGGADCDDDDAAVSPAAVEAIDGIDNQCPGAPGGGLVDELGPTLRLGVAGDRDALVWTAPPGAAAYRVERSSSPEFDASCAAFDVAATTFDDPAAPGAGGGLFYLVRAAAPFAGSAGAGSNGVERAGCP